jgi:hypothetical protein
MQEREDAKSEMLRTGGFGKSTERMGGWKK